MISPKQTLKLLSRTYSEWSGHDAPRLGASVAFYSILSFAPLMVLVTAIIGLVFGHESAQGALINEARQLIGDRGADTVESLLKNAQKPTSGAFASIVAFVTLLFGASGVFSELQDALNLMWDVRTQPYSGVMGMIKQRLFSFGMVLSVGFLLLVSLLLSACLAFIGHSFSQLVPIPPAALESINFVVSFAVITGLFALMFKYVPNTKVSWNDVGVGAVGTALLFTIGKWLLGLYLGKAGVGSTYGAAGSLVAVVVWIYYSAQIFFFGAEFTHLYGEQGKEHGPAPEAKPAAAAVSSEREEKQSMAMAAAAAAAPSPTPALHSPPAAPSPQPPAPAPTVHAATVRSPTPAITQTAPIETLPSAPAPTTARLRPLPGRTPRPRTKPELVTSLAVGFLLGRLTGRLEKRHDLPQG